MLLRLFLALLLAASVVPAAAGAMCHAESPAMAHHGMPPAPENVVAADVCIGCVPLADWLGARVAARIVPDAGAPAMIAVRLDLGRAVAPALPPPRRA